MSYFIPAEWALALAAFGIVALLVGLSRLGKGVLMLSAVLFLYRPIKGFLLLFFPLWIALLIGALSLLVAIRASLSMLFGKEAVDNMVGQLLANSVVSILSVFRRVLIPLWLRFFSSWKLLGGLTVYAVDLIDMFRPKITNLADPGLGNQDFVAEPSEDEILGNVVDVGQIDSLVKLSDGSLGRLSHGAGVSTPQLHQLLKCRIVVRKDSGIHTLIEVKDV